MLTSSSAFISSSHESSFLIFSFSPQRILIFFSFSIVSLFFSLNFKILLFNSSIKPQESLIVYSVSSELMSSSLSFLSFSLYFNCSFGKGSISILYGKYFLIEAIFSFLAILSRISSISSSIDLELSFFIFPKFKYSIILPKYFSLT